MSNPPHLYSPSLDENEASSSTSFQPPLYHPLRLNPLLFHQQHQQQQPQFWSPSHLAPGPSGFFPPQQGGWGFNGEGAGGGAFGGGPGQGMGGGEQQAGMELSQGQMHRLEKMASVPCTFFFSPQGCLNGDRCRFSHDENPGQHQEAGDDDDEDNQEYGPPPPEPAAGPSRKRDRTVSATDSEKEAKLEDKAALLRRRLQEAKAARLSKPSSPSTPKPTPVTSSTPAPTPSSPTPSLPTHLLDQLSTLLSTLTTAHSLLSLPAKPLPPPNPFQISPLTEELLTTRLELDHERGRNHRWGVVVEKGERVREELDERRRRREQEEAERVAFLRTSTVGKADQDLDLGLSNPSSRDNDSTGQVEEEDFRCALRVLGVLARGERELANQTQSHLSLNPNPSSNLPPINYTSSSSSSYSQGRSTFTSSLTPPTKKAWTPQEHAMLRRIEADLHNPPRMSGTLGGGLGGGTMGGGLSPGGGGMGDALGAMGMGGKGAGGVVVQEEPRLALPSRAEGGGW